MQQDHATLRAVAVGGALEHAHQPHERNVEPEHRVPAAMRMVLEEVIAYQLLLVIDVFFLAMCQNHVVYSLKRVAGNARVPADDVEIVLEAAFPMELLVLVVVL